MNIERDICKKLISGVLKPALKKAPGGGAGDLICCLGHHSQTFSALKLLPAHFCNFSPHFDLICLSNSLTPPRLTIRSRLKYDGTNQ